jgi:hypothetical protein
VKPKNQKEVIVMIQQTVFPFKIETTKAATKNQGAGGVAAYLDKRVWGWGESEKRTRGQ